jgi:hypothetical protein
MATLLQGQDHPQNTRTRQEHIVSVLVFFFAGHNNHKGTATRPKEFIQAKKSITNSCNNKK